ncbi:MAG: hypothetical protein JWO38_5927 [Gemmataceae bacterium]|nr:hypothetical protein [Gemmataceae bacterium]
MDLDDDPPATDPPGKKPVRKTPTPRKPVAELDEDEDAPRRPGRRGQTGPKDQPARQETNRRLLFKLLILGAVGVIGCFSLGGAVAYIGYMLSSQNSGIEDK